MAEETYAINYFDVRGLAEPVRIILSYGGAKWEDRRISVANIPPSIPEELKARLPYGQVPFLEFGGQGLSQAFTILRFLARKYDLVGEGELEAAKCDEVGDAVKDLLAIWMPFYQKFLFNKEASEEEKKQALEKVKADSRTKFLSRFEAQLEANGGHFVGNKLTWADIVVAHHVDNIQIGLGLSITDGLPALQKLIQTVYATKGIKEWIESRPKTQF